MEYYIKTVCTKTYFFSITTLPCDDKSIIHLNKRKKILRDALKWGEIDIRSSTGSIVISIDFSYFHHQDASWGFLSCRLFSRVPVFWWLSYLLPKTAMEILRKYKRQKDENSAGRVYIHWFWTSGFLNSNLMSSQRTIFNWLRDQTIKLVSI